MYVCLPFSGPPLRTRTRASTRIHTRTRTRTRTHTDAHSLYHESFIRLRVLTRRIPPVYLPPSPSFIQIPQEVRVDKDCPNLGAYVKESYQQHYFHDPLGGLARWDQSTPLPLAAEQMSASEIESSPAVRYQKNKCWRWLEILFILYQTGLLQFATAPGLLKMGQKFDGVMLSFAKLNAMLFLSELGVSFAPTDGASPILSILPIRPW